MPAAQLEPVGVGVGVALGCDTVGTASKPSSATTSTNIVNFFALRRWARGVFGSAPTVMHGAPPSRSRLDVLIDNAC